MLANSQGLTDRLGSIAAFLKLPEPLPPQQRTTSTTSSPTRASRQAPSATASDGPPPPDRLETAAASTGRCMPTATRQDRPTATPPPVLIPKKSRSGGRRRTCMSRTTSRISWNVSAATSLRLCMRMSSKRSWTARSRVCALTRTCGHSWVFVADWDGAYLLMLCCEPSISTLAHGWSLRAPALPPNALSFDACFTS